ncbi:hypothetical protein PR048_017875 [Dryococelus australis]|uniref:Uncharacterized protein n=1 Tax=Dryococelus australis TaxID=614101 RepID=A0ABQ9HAV0_9NEOP|nr:hypothetical protein PR048_017875 [Dryococelus australis]
MEQAREWLSKLSLSDVCSPFPALPKNLPFPPHLLSLIMQSLWAHMRSSGRKSRAAQECKDVGKREKIRATAASSGMIPTCGNLGATPSGIEPDSPLWRALYLLRKPSSCYRKGTLMRDAFEMLDDKLNATPAIGETGRYPKMVVPIKLTSHDNGYVQRVKRSCGALCCSAAALQGNARAMTREAIFLPCVLFLIIPFIIIFLVPCSALLLAIPRATSPLQCAPSIPPLFPSLVPPPHLNPSSPPDHFPLPKLRLYNLLYEAIPGNRNFACSRKHGRAPGLVAYNTSQNVIHKPASPFWARMHGPTRRVSQLACSAGELTVSRAPPAGPPRFSALPSGRVTLRSSQCKAHARGVTVSLLASHQGGPGSIAHRVTPDFRTWESCRTMQLIGGFSRGSPVQPPAFFSFLCCAILTSITLSSQGLYGASVAEWLDCSLPTEANPGQFTQNFRKWESCRTMPLVDGFSRVFPVSPAPSFRSSSMLTSLHPHRLIRHRC